MDKTYKGYRNLKAWQLANKLAHLIYDITSTFPRSETYGLASQMCRAALSVAANIAEGYIRRSQRDKRHFYNIALSSLTELEYYIDFAHERNLYSKELHSKLSAVQTEAAKVLTGLIKSVKT